MSIKQAIEALEAAASRFNMLGDVERNGASAATGYREATAALAALRSMPAEPVGEREAFEAELRKQCFQKPTTEAHDLAWSMWKARALRSYETQSPAVEQVEHLAPYRCLKPHCPPRCDGCNHAIPVTDTARMLMVKVLDSLAVDDLGNPFEEGDHMAVDEARAWLCEATPHTAPLSDAEIGHLWEINVGEPTQKYPFTQKDWINFARAIERAVLRGGEK